MSNFTTTCPHCNGKLETRSEWLGLELICPLCNKSFVLENDIQPEVPVAAEKDCPKCGEKINLQATRCKFCKSDLTLSSPETAAEMPVQKFTFICSECGTVAELPEALNGKEYECLSCCETVIALPATERPCPFCGEKIKIKAMVCKYCRKNVPALAAMNKPVISLQEKLHLPELNSKIQDAGLSISKFRGDLKNFEDQVKAKIKNQFKTNPKRFWIILGSSATLLLTAAAGITWLCWDRSEDSSGFSSGSSSGSRRISTSGRYASDISSVMSNFSYRDTMSSNINQQICNGTYRTVELLNIIAQQVGGSTSSVMSNFSYRDTMSSNINQQICNGTYRTVELLDIIARKRGCSTSSIMSNFSYRDTMSNNINQQICNGTYRTVELLDVIARDMGCSTSSVMSNFSYRDTMANNINQQICNGTYRTVELLNIIAKKIDE